MKRKNIFIVLAIIVSLFWVGFEGLNVSAAGFRPRITIINSKNSGDVPGPSNTGEVMWVTDSVYADDSGEEFVFKVDYDLQLFRTLKVNGVELKRGEDYVLEEGSTVVVFAAEYMNGLNPGEYTAQIEYNDGRTIMTQFRVASEESNNKEDNGSEGEDDDDDSEALVVPNTGFGVISGGGSSGILCGGAVIGLGALVVVLLKRSRKRFNRTSLLSWGAGGLVKALFEKTRNGSRKSFTLRRVHLMRYAVVLFVVLSGIGIGFGLSNRLSNNDVDATIKENIDSLTISTSSEVFEAELDLKDGEAFVSTWQDVSIDVPTKNGYQLFISTNSDSYNDLSINGSIEGGERIVASLGTVSAPMMLNGDEWGYALEGGAFGQNYTPSSTSLWAGVPSYGTSSLVKTVYGPTAVGDTTRVYYGFHATNNLPNGSYSGTENSAVVYAAVANVVPEYKVSYDCNGGVGSIESIIKQAGESVQLSDGVGCTREGYTLEKWNTNRLGSGQDYALGAQYAIDANLYLFAVWDKNEPDIEPEPQPNVYTFNLNYDANGGVDAPTSQSITTTEASAAFVVSVTRPTRGGYEFQGWSTNKWATTGEYAPNSSIVVASNTTLYAIWSMAVPVKVSSVSVNGASDIDYNGLNATQLNATVAPSNAANRSITWYSSNNGVATVNSAGLVSGVNAGHATIYARANDGSGVVGSFVVHVKKKIVIVIGASQVTRMANAISSYASPSGRHYNVNDTLFFKYLSGSGFAYQYDAGWNDAYANIVLPYSGVSDVVEFYIYLPMAGNGIKGFTCEEISNSNGTIREFAGIFDNNTASLKGQGFNVSTTVVSVHPLRPGQASSKYVVSNSNQKRCDKDYRSNYKYYQFNKAMMSIVRDHSNVRYLPLFSQIMDTSNSNSYDFKDGWSDYGTTDGVHWNVPTTIKYTTAMLNHNNAL